MMFKRAKEEWHTSETRHKVGIVVLALVVIGVKLFVPPEQRPPQRPGPAYIQVVLMRVF